MHEVELWVVIDSEGNYGTGAELSTAHEAYEQSYSEEVRRVLCVKLAVELPVATILEGTVPLTGQGATLTVAG